MKGLRHSLDTLPSSARRLANPTFSKELHSVKFNWEVESPVVEADPERLAKLVHQARTAMKGGEMISRPRDLAQLCIALWDPQFGLSKSEKFVEFYLSCLNACPANSPFKSLGRQYLFHWPASERAGGRIQLFLRESEARRVGGWMRSAFEYRLFNGEEAVPYLAEIALSGPSAPLENLEPTGLRGAALSGAYAEAIFVSACTHTKSAPTREKYGKLIEFQHETGAPLRAPRFPSTPAKNAYLDAFLSPWSRRNIDVQLKRWITKTLIDQFNDPRLSMAKWAGVSEPLVLTFKKWLAQESLEQFLNIVDQSITEFSKRRMWSYRRPFWTSYFNAGYVHEAWVLFGHDALKLARSAQNQDESFSSSFGVLESADRSQSVLLMKIGDAIIAEWSHNGKCWIWPNETKAPKLYKKEMTGDACRHAPFEQIHGGAENYRWQSAVASELHRLGIPKTHSAEWIPK